MSHDRCHSFGNGRIAQARLKRLALSGSNATFDEMLHVIDRFGVVRIELSPASDLIAKTVSQVKAGLEIELVLGIERDKRWLSTANRTRKQVGSYRLVVC